MRREEGHDQVVGRLVLEIQVIKSLGEYQTDFDIAGIVDDVITTYGYRDLHEIDPHEYAALVLRHNKAPHTGA